MDRVSAIRKSLTTFVCGLVGLVPILGIVPAGYAWVCWRQVRNGYGKKWNPAERYLKWGAFLAVLGLLLSLLVGAGAMLALFEAWENSGFFG